MTVLIAGYARTPFVKANGQFADVPATVLGATAVKAALKDAGVSADQVDFVYAGQVLQGGAGQNPARQTAVGAGISLDVPAMTVNAVCLSGMEAVIQGTRLIQSGEADVVVAVGQESMTLAPHVWVGARAGKRFGGVELVDTMEHDGLSDAFDRISMGASTEDYNGPLNIAREDQDAFAAASHQRTAAAIADGTFSEITPVEVPGRKGSVTVSQDDGVRPETTVETLAKLRPAFREGGTITAGTASQISDGAAAVVLVSETWAADNGVQGIAKVVSHAFVAGPDTSLQAQPSNAIKAALSKTEHTASDLASVEINEAFAAVGIHSTRELGVDSEIVNPHGGAIALGHPIGASGARLVGHLAQTLSAAGPGSLGAAALCGGGGQGTAVILEAV
jgi:acetyl-CoA C-acetyltransferase